ncbi:MAG: 7-cyano-7-deazaguanine synthase QueC [Acidobacteriota bacterium]
MTTTAATTATTTATESAIVLLSGGLDSATVLAIAQEEGYRIHALSFRYGQRHDLELQAASRLARRAEVAEHRVVDIDLRPFGGSALTTDLPVPKARSIEEISDDEIPVTYVPARNTIFLSFALAAAETRDCCDIFIGVNAVDYSGYPDCRPEYIGAFQQMANLATRAGVEAAAEGRAALRIRTPLLDLSKAEIIRRGLELGVDYGLTLSCYDPTPRGEACGGCDACLLRLAGFAENGIPDPGRYADMEKPPA